MILFSSSGTAAFESAYANLLSPGDRILVVSAGNFGERWVKMGEAYRADVEVLRSPWGSRPDPEAVAARVNGRSDLAAVFVVHSETSTGATADVRAIAELTRDRSACLVVDAISSLGATPLETDAWGLDVVVTGSQKALMTPPGLAFASVSERARARAATADESAVLARLGACAAGAGQGPDAVHAGHLAGERPRRGAADDRSRRPGGAVRADPAAGPRRPRRHEGDRARAVLARPRRLLARDGRAVAAGHRRRGDPRAPSATATA